MATDTARSGATARRDRFGGVLSRHCPAVIVAGGPVQVSHGACSMTIGGAVAFLVAWTTGPSPVGEM